MRPPALTSLILAMLVLSSCADSLRSQEPTQKLTAGFWFWHGSALETTLSREPLDVLFVHAGTIQRETAPFYVKRAANPSELWHVYGELPDHLPPARQYWLVFRFEQQGVPDLLAAP